MSRTCCGGSRRATSKLRSMIRHTVIFKWTEEATQEQKQAVFDELSKLPSLVPSVRAFVIGPDARLADGTFDFAVTADFEDETGWAAYRDAPEHRAVIRDQILPITQQRVAVQFKF
jgi:hypothetical protein